MKNTTKIYLSKQGFKELKKKIAKLEHEQKMLEMELRDGDIKEDLLNKMMFLRELMRFEVKFMKRIFKFIMRKFYQKARKKVRKFRSVHLWNFSIVQLGEL